MHFRQASVMRQYYGVLQQPMHQIQYFIFKMLIYNQCTIYELVGFLNFFRKTAKCFKLKYCRLFGMRWQGSSPFKYFLLTSLMRLTSFSLYMLASFHLVGCFLYLPMFLFLTCTFLLTTLSVQELTHFQSTNQNTFLKKDAFFLHKGTSGTSYQQSNCYFIIKYR